MTGERSTADLVADDLRASRRYGAITEAVIARTATWAAARSRSRREAVKLARRKLHQIHGAFLGASELRGAERMLAAVEGPLDDDRLRDLCTRVLRCHASTAERLPSIEEFSAAVRRFAPAPATVVDLACGLNPFALPWLGLPPGCTYHAIDLDARVLALVRRLDALQPVRVTVSEADLVSAPPSLQADAVLLLKAAPSLERQEQGATRRLLESVRAPVAFVSFPARSLGGRERGMRATYEAALDRLLPDDLERVAEADLPTETVYVLERRSPTGVPPP